MANQKFHALARISDHMNQGQTKKIISAFINSQFGYCPLVWMFHSRKLNNRINKIHEKSLRLVYKVKNTSFNELLSMDNSVTVHHRNIRVLATEIFKARNNLGPKSMQSIFVERSIPYSLRKARELRTKKAKSTKYGTETVTFRAPEIWGILPEEIKHSESLGIFKTRIKQWTPSDCKCRLCKTYISNVGFI